MNANRLRIGFIVVALLAINGGLSGLGYHGWYGAEVALARLGRFDPAFCDFRSVSD
jgi:hypothetical protein